MSWRADQLDRFELDRFRGCESDDADPDAPQSAAMLLWERPRHDEDEEKDDE